MKYSSTPSNSHNHTIKLNLPNKDPLHTPRPKNYTPKSIKIAHPTVITNSGKRAHINTKLIPYLDPNNILSLFPKGFKYNIGQLYIKDKLGKTPKNIYHPLIKSKSCFDYFPLKRKDKKRVSCPGNYNSNKIEIKIGDNVITFGKEDKSNTNNKISIESEENIHKDFIEKQGKKISNLKAFKFLEEIMEEDSSLYNHTEQKFYKKNSPSTTIGKTKIFNLLSPKEKLEIPVVKDYDNRIKSIPIIRKKEQQRNRIQTAKKRFFIGLAKSLKGQKKYNIIRKEPPNNTIGKKTKIAKNLLVPFDPNNFNLKKTNIFQNNYRTWKIGTEPKIKSSNSCKNILSSEANTIYTCRNCMAKFKYAKQKSGKLTIINFNFPQS